MDAHLLRVTPNKKEPQKGALLINGRLEIVTLELPWLNNLPKKSCIPEGVYSCEKVRNRTTGGGTFIRETFLVKDVPGRSGILFHVGNSVLDTEGCILVGLKLPSLAGQDLIEQSVLAFNKFLAITGGVEKMTLQISSI